MGLLSPGQRVWEEAPCEVGQGHRVLSVLAGPSCLPPFQSGDVFSVPSWSVSLTKPRGDLDRMGRDSRGTGLEQQENRVFLDKYIQRWLSIHHCFSLCALSTGLLHPGDKIIKEGEDVRKIRQPGGYYSTGHADAASSLSVSKSKSASGKQAKEAENRLVHRGLMISPFLLPCCASAPSASEVVLRY